MSPARRALARRTLAGSRWLTLSFALLFAVVTAVNAAGYRRTYPTHAERVKFATTFGANKSLRLFYGTPHDLLDVGGYTAWRAGGLLAIFAGAWGVFAAVRALRGEEDAGRTELMLVGAVTRRALFWTVAAALAGGVLALWAAAFLGLAAARLPVGGSADLALAIVGPAAVFSAVGALASQVAPTRREASLLAGGCLVLALLARVAADTSGSLGVLRWVTPLGWSEELRPFAGPRPWVLLLFAAATAALLAGAAGLAARRDVQGAVFRSRDTAAPSGALLGSPTAQALRLERVTLAAWILGTGAFAFVLGGISNSVSSISLSPAVREELRKLGASSITTPSGYLGFAFIFLVLAVSLFGCAQIGAARHEEAEGRLEALFAQPVGRRGWLAGRLLLAVAGAAAVALAAGVLAWAGAAVQGADVGFADLVEAGANTLPPALLFLGLGALLLAVVPRASVGLAYGLTTLAFVWELFGAVIGIPSWALDLSPFHHVGHVPAEHFRAGAGAVMLGVAAWAALVATWAFSRRDLVPG
jgi:polyether ionophore transport system permease protein